MPKTTLKACLNIPSDVADATNNPRTVPLRWTPHHPAAHAGTGALVSREGEILDGPSFRAMCDALAAHIATTDPATICRALGLPRGEPGIGA